MDGVFDRDPPAGGLLDGTWHDAGPVPPDLNGPRGHPFVPLPEDAADRPLAQLLAQAAALRPAAPALDDGALRLDHAATLDRVRRLAGAIAAATERGAVVAILLPVGTMLPVALLGVVAAGRIAAPVDPAAPPQRQAQLIEAAGAALVLTDGAAARSLPAGTRWLDAAALSLESAPATLPPTDPDAPAFLLLTSGSTGTPKGIVLGQAAVTLRVADHVATSHIASDDRVAPLSWPGSIAGLREVLAGLLAGACVHLIEPRGREAAATLERLAAVRPTVVYAVPTLLRALCRLPGAARGLSALRVLRLGGEAIHWADLDTLRPHLPPGAHVMAAYSSTEAAGAHWFVPPDAPRDTPTVPGGWIAPGGRFRIVDETGRDATEGELVLRGRHVALGLWQRGRLVPGPVAADPEDPRSRLLRSGDRARLLPDGRLLLLGRVDGMVKIAGHRVEPREVEAAMRSWPEVEDAAVVVVEPARPRLVGFIVPRVEAPDFAATARRRLRAALPAAMQPARLHLIAAVPLTAAGKPDRAALAAHDAALDTRRPPRADAEIAWAVARAWRRSFGRASLRADESFQDAGGDSLALLRLVYDIEQGLGAFTYLPLDLFSVDMRPGEMAAAIGGALRAAPRCKARPRLWLLPGLAGDEPLLALFRADLADRLDATTPAYPEWRDQARAQGGLEAMAAALAGRIAAETPDGPLRLGGYSFGGVVAAAVAARLAAMGREVAFLGLIDASALLPARPQHGRALRRAIAGHGVMRQALAERRVADVLGMGVAETLARPGLAPLLRGLAGMPAPRMPPRLHFTTRAWLNALLRAEASRAWLAQAAPLPAGIRTVLFRSGGHPPGTPSELGWGRLCGGVEVVEVPGSHHGMFEAGNRALLAARFAGAALG